MMYRRATLVLIALLVAPVASLAIGAQPTTAPASTSPSPYRIVRHTEDWSFLRDPARSHSVFDPIKYIPLGRDDAYLSIGGEARLVYEFFDNNAFGAGPQDDDGFLLQRYMLHADLHVTDAFRAFVDLKANPTAGREGGPRPPDRDDADLHQAFIDLSVRPTDDLRLTFRPGRQELFYGSARLIAHRNGPNVRQSFDALKLIARAEDWQIDGFFARPVLTDPESWDDDADDSRSLWSVYATRTLKPINGGFDLYYIGFHNDAARFASGAGDETRHTLGTRLFGKQGALDWNWELMGQVGEFDDDRIRAWSIGTETGYTFAGAPTKPRVAIKANIISGDTDPDDNSLGTFNAMFPRGGYFGEIGVVGPANLINLHPQVDFQLRRDLTLTVDSVFFWRYSEDDGLYAASGALVRGAGADAGRYIGTQPSVILSYRPTDQLTFIGTYSVFFPGEVIDATGADETIHFVRFEAQIRF